MKDKDFELIKINVSQEQLAFIKKHKINPTKLMKEAIADLRGKKK